ncbi:hypothetical protein Nos7524_4818 [Nostoc sp. PCC 7524]|uniref:hypothetical protein n=1 Tax=Nostoc sp. (strain ATCC 29411 / PCC 7524) TaxID=28072 RepID=UPI00029F31A1|nr:hypothetical protein [Nostoc sp. PCC 7524]AFY50555.1 hypothetical protein Nos7524_4818 [Nostoc sp. PCC 7524]
MSQSIHFGRIKYFSEEFTKNRKYADVLQELKKILEKEEKVDETLQDKFTEDIKLTCININAYGEIEKLLKTGSEIQLHPKSRYYFVNETIWELIEEKIFQESKQVETKKDYYEIVEDYITIKDFFKKKVLVFEVS